MLVVELMGTVVLLDGRLVVRDAIVALLLQELLVLQTRRRGIRNIQRGRSRGFAVIKPVVFHVDLNLLGLAR